MEMIIDEGIRADNGEPYSETYPRYGVPVGNRKGMHAVCVVCRIEYPQTEMVKIGGGWYCTKEGHAQDRVEDIRRSRKL